MRRYAVTICLLAALTLAAVARAPAQNADSGSDPVRVTVGQPDVDARRLPTGATLLTRPGDGADAAPTGVYTVDVVPREGGDERLIVQTNRLADGWLVDSVLVRGRAMTPVWHRARHSRGRLDLRYEDGGRRVRGTEWTAEGEVVPIDAALDESRYPAAIGALLLRALPLRPGYAVEIPLSRRGEPTRMAARVAGREAVETAVGTRDAWRVEITFDGGGTAKQWVGVEDNREIATNARLPNGGSFRQTQAALTESAARARTHLRGAAEAMGGEHLLRRLGAVRIGTIGHTNMLEQSERPEGPWIEYYRESTELRDSAHGRLRRTSRVLTPVLLNREMEIEWTPITRIFDGDAAALAFDGRDMGAGRVFELEEARESLALGPERVLLTALDAADLRAEPDTTLQGIPHHVVAFTWRDRPVRVFLNAYTDLPTAVERTREHPFDAWSPWGDVTTRTLFHFWTLESNGLMYPRQWTTVRNGLPARDIMITRLELGAAAPADSFAIPEDVRTAFHEMPVRGLSDYTLGITFGGAEAEAALEIEPGIVFIPGAWNTTLVRQEQGVVVLEAPISSTYSAEVVDEAARRMPDARVVAAVSTSDAWWHVGGVREYVARGVPVYAHALSLPMLEHLTEAPHTFRPDSLDLAPREPEFRAVDGPVAVGDGANRFTLFPIYGEGGERMLAAYFPEHRLLYASDLIQRRPDGTFFMPEYLHEVRRLVEREGLDVETVFAMHTAPLPWRDVLAAIPGPAP